MAERIRETFKGVPERDVDSFMQSSGMQSHTNSLCTPNGPARLFVFQEESKESAAPTLKVSTGADDRLKGKFCYFIRSAPEGKGVDASKVCDADLSFGSLNDVPLKTLEVLLNQLYKPLVDEQTQLGKADEGQTSEFKSEMGHFIGDLQEMLSSMSGGLELRKPETVYDGFGKPADSKLVSEYQELLDEWCKTIEEYLNSGDKAVSGITSSDTSQGPVTELEYWRKRMQRLTSITEQVKSKECRSVIQVLSALTKGPNLKDPTSGNDDRQNVFALLRRWKQLDISITESANEAKDNVKYLFTLEKFIEPLYSGTPVSIIDTIPALMNSIKMIHTIARYYNTTERMTGLFAKVTNQMIENCKMCINEGDSHDQLWAKNPEELVRRLEACLKLNEAYQDQYRVTKDKLLAMPKGKQFDFNETHIFGKFDLFCRRVIKLIDMFSTIHQFISLGDNQLEGMESLIEGFQNIIREFRSKNHDLLDFHNNKFDRDYVEFNVKISDLETQLQNFINDSFESITSIEQSLNLLRKFQSILQRENLKSDVDSKFNVIFQNYGFELEQVQKLYEAQKHSPPIPRNLPPVAGNIKWSRHLLKRIEDPMKR
jgi:dynein heavy chain